MNSPEAAPEIIVQNETASTTSLREELEDKKATVESVLKVLGRNAEDSQNSKLQSIIQNHLKLLSENRENNIDEVRMEEDIKAAIEEIEFWHEHQK